MTSLSPDTPGITGVPVPRRRRVPTQARSRERVARLLDATSAEVLAHGVEALTTRSIADRAGMPVASLYQYFADRDDVLLALIERDVREMDEQVSADLGRLETITLESVVTTTMRAFISVYHRRPAFVKVYLRGRTNAAIDRFCMEHNLQVARDLYSFGRAAGLLTDDIDLRHVRLAVEVGDQVFQLAFADRLEGDDFLLDEGIKLVTGYLRPYTIDPVAP